MKFKFTIRKDRPNFQGKCQVVLTINANGRLRIPLNEWVNPGKWDEINQCVKSSDPDAKGINTMIDFEREKILKIKREAVINGDELTFEFIYNKYKTTETRQNFVAFMYAELNNNERKKILAKETLKHHKVVFEKIKQITNGRIVFKSVNYEFFERFHAHLVGNGSNPTTIHNNFKILKTYLNLAKSKGIPTNDSYLRYRIPAPQSKTIYLTVNELHKLMNYYERPGILSDHKKTLQCFLFSATTGGVRYGDMRFINRHHIINDFLVFMPEKTKHINKTVNIHMNQLSFKYINDKGPLFDTVFTNQQMNRNLKEIAKLLGIKKQLTYHVARHTFGTNYIKAGGTAEMLQIIMGHEDINTTMNYVHLAKADEQNRADMVLFEKYVTPSEKRMKAIVVKMAS